MADGDATLTQWVVGAIATGTVALLAFLARFVFGGVFKRLDELRAENNASNAAQVSEIRSIGNTVQTQVTAQAVTEVRIARVEAENAILRVKLDDIAGFLQSDGYRKRDGRDP